MNGWLIALIVKPFVVSGVIGLWCLLRGALRKAQSGAGR
jgi:hypothetical protein